MTPVPRLTPGQVHLHLNLGVPMIGTILIGKTPHGAIGIQQIEMTAPGKVEVAVSHRKRVSTWTQFSVQDVRCRLRRRSA